MKQIAIVFILSIAAGSVKAQQTTAEAFSLRVAKRISDSLNLSTAQQQAIYTVNLDLQQQKMSLWGQYGNVPDTLTLKVQAIEDRRDSLYRVVLGDDTKWLLYKQKKTRLLNNN